jgi:GNAT superfamily N-acetyltransferase
VRVGPWRRNGHLAILSPATDGRPPSPEFLRHCVEELAAAGYHGAVTAALTPPEQAAFAAAGFHEEERLRLLTHDLRNLPPAPSAPLRKANEADHPAVLAVDACCFRPFWRLDEWGLQDALSATPVARFRVVVHGERVAGYAISGRTHRKGYLQRLAVHPVHRGQGWGQALVLDGLRWMRRRGVERAVVNTQLDNSAAHALYLRLGFREEPWSLAVFRQDFS